MIAQLAPEVVRPDIVWQGLVPILTLAIGALLLILFRSLMKSLPAAVTAQMVPAIGAATVVAISNTNGSGPDAGAEKAIGFVPSERSVPP